MKKILKGIALGLGVICTAKHGLGVIIVMFYFGLFE